jgi:hypothetical protein
MIANQPIDGIPQSGLCCALVSTAKGGGPVSKTLAVFAVALGVIVISAGSAFAGGGCGSYTTQSVSLETQTASTGSTGEQTPHLPISETSSN